MENETFWSECIRVKGGEEFSGWRRGMGPNYSDRKERLRS